MNSQAKIALRCDSEDELLLLQATAQSLNLCAHSIQDAYVSFFNSSISVTKWLHFLRGRTQIAAGSRTVLGIGPGKHNTHPTILMPMLSHDLGPVKLINQVTGKLKLL